MSTVLKVGAVLLPFLGNIPGSFYTKDQIKDWYNVCQTFCYFILKFTE
jgi:hypothetical protein